MATSKPSDPQYDPRLLALVGGNVESDDRDDDEPDDDREDDDDGAAQPPGGGEDDSSDDDEELREAGKRALRAERRKVRELEAENRRLKAAAKRTAAKKTDESERETIRAELSQEFAVELARERAIGLLKDVGYRGNPERGAKLLELEDVIVDGKVDKEALRDAVESWRDDEPSLFRRSRKDADADDDEDDAPTARRRTSGSADLGRKKISRPQDEDALAKLIREAVGNPRLF